MRKQSQSETASNILSRVCNTVVHRLCFGIEQQNTNQLMEKHKRSEGRRVDKDLERVEGPLQRWDEERGLRRDTDISVLLSALGGVCRLDAGGGERGGNPAERKVHRTAHHTPGSLCVRV